mmetsp:Transcript_27709/g.70649  ORF Transcript_27709/g.70649 Transcript_27709/m.70649 type:complete len:162 (-) Transcript_27709:309-794(-)
MLGYVDDSSPESLVFAGGGEPLLRLRVLEEAAAGLATRGLLTMRLNTNGLVPLSEAVETACRMKKSGISSVSVALMTADAAQYDELMKPEALRYSPGFSLTVGHAEVVGFVEACLSEGLEVECTAVASPGVDIGAAQTLSENIGANFRTRSWHAANQSDSK